MSSLADPLTGPQTRASCALCQPTCRHSAHGSSSTSPCCPTPIQSAGASHVQPAAVQHVHPAVVHHGHPTAVHHVHPALVHHGHPTAVHHVHPAAVHHTQLVRASHVELAAVRHVQPAAVPHVLLAAVQQLQTQARPLETAASIARPHAHAGLHTTANFPSRCRNFSALASAELPEGPVPHPWGPDGAREHGGKKVECDVGYSAPVVLETRALAPQADGSCLLRCGDVQLLATVVCETGQESGRPGDRAGHGKRQDKRRLRVSRFGSSSCIRVRG